MVPRHLKDKDLIEWRKIAGKMYGRGYVVISEIDDDGTVHLVATPLRSPPPGEPVNRFRVKCAGSKCELEALREMARLMGIDV